MKPEAIWPLAVTMAKAMGYKYGLTPDEMTSVAGFAAMRACRSYRPGMRKFDGHLYQAIMTEAMDHVRELRPRRKHVPRLVPLDACDDNGGSWDKVLANCRESAPHTAVDTADQLESRLRDLPSGHKKALLMRFAGYQYSEIGEALRVSASCAFLWCKDAAGRIPGDLQLSGGRVYHPRKSHSKQPVKYPSRRR